MWLLIKVNDGTTKYLISENKSYTVGRKNCDIVLENDASVSRKHCTFHLAKQSESSISIPTSIWVFDEQSKYGTYLKNDNIWVQLNTNERNNLTSGSIIKFGLLENNWRLEYKPIVACTSGVPVEQKKTLNNILKSIDGCLRSSWCKECSLVIANEIILTVKVVLALINGIPIVTPVYIEKVAEAVRNQIELPEYKNYQPVIKESILEKSLVSLDTKNHRKELFKGKKFIIPTEKQLEILRDVITCAGGTVELFSSTHIWESFGDNDIIVIQLPPNSSGISKELNKCFKEIASFLKTNYGRRVVPESEIAQAVAYCSIEKFCNPKSMCFNLRIGEREQLDLGPSLVEETPTMLSQDINHSQLGLVLASATYESATPLHGNTELNPTTDKSVVLQSSLPTDIPLKLQHESQQSLPQRKRTHDLDLVDQETPNKRSRNPGNSTDESSRLPKIASTEERETQNKPDEHEESANPRKTVDAASSSVTNNFQKRNELLTGKIRVTRQSSSEFWGCEVTYKRKTSTESQNSDEEQIRKKLKLLESTKSKQRTSEITADKDVADCVQKNRKHSFPSPRKIPEVVEENDFSDYFGKETSDADIVLDELNNTILSLTIIPPSFLKEDGSLIDPPDVPFNVKKFKKRKIQILNAQDDDELSDGEWIEPHSNRLNISVLDEDDEC